MLRRSEYGDTAKFRLKPYKRYHVAEFELWSAEGMTVIVDEKAGRLVELMRLKLRRYRKRLTSNLGQA